ncbi:MAG: DUF4262 domain-containing protein [Dietzia sp.]
MSNTTIQFRPVAAIDPDMALVAATIDRYGLHLVHVGEGCACEDCESAPLPPDQRFGYTVGLTDRGHPELLVRGLGARETAGLLNRWGGCVLDGQVLDAGHLLCEGPDEPTWELVPVRRPSRTLRWAGRYYRTAGTGGLTALELVPARRPCPCDGCC